MTFLESEVGTGFKLSGLKLLFNSLQFLLINDLNIQMSKEVKENSPIRDLPITGVKLCSNSQGLSCQERPVLAEIEINKSPETEMINSAQIDKEKPQKTERNETNPPVKDDSEKEGSETQNPAPCLTLSEVKESKTQREQKVIEKIPETPPSKQPQSPLTYQQGQKAKVDMPLVCKRK
jgi:hypothetical protein